MHLRNRQANGGSRGRLGVVHPFADHIIVSKTFIVFVLSRAALEAPELGRTIHGAYTPADVNIEEVKFFDDGGILEGRCASFTTLAATATIMAIVKVA